MDSELAAKDREEPVSPMTGTLADTTPAGVLQVLSSRGSTGAVRFLGDSGCTVYLYRGELYFAEDDATAEDLAVALVRPERLSARQWDDATEAGYPTETVGEELISTGAIDRELLASVVLSVIYDPLIALFRAPVGDYEFAPDVVHWIGPYRTFDVDAIVSEVRRRTREADEMTPVIPSLDAVARSARTLPEQHGSVNLRRDDWEVIVAAANGSTVTELAVELGRGRWSTARLVYRLAGADLLTVTVADTAGTTDSVDEEASTDAPDEAPDDDLTSHADPWNIEDLSTDAWSDGADDPADSWASPGQATTDDPWAAPAVDDTFGDPDTAASEPDPGPDRTGGLSAVPDAPADFEVPDLHPDIAKALAESTYADSATAINAMAARLGALDADDDTDDWDTGTGTGDGDEFWSAETAAPRGEDFIWKPAVWDTGTETAPLPRREGARADTQRAAGDPAWLDNLYNEFMPGDGADPDHAAVGAPSADAPKPRGLRRLLSAIRRL